MRLDVLVELAPRWECLLTALVHVAEFFKLFTMHLTFVVFQVERIGVRFSALIANQLRFRLMCKFMLVQCSSSVANLTALIASTVDLLAGYAFVDMGLQFFEAAELTFARHAHIVTWIGQTYNYTFGTGQALRFGLHR